MSELVFDAQNPLNCPICLNLLKNPVTTSCGHSFCMDCINVSWDQDASMRRAYSCPTCRRTFNQKPALCKSTVPAEIVEGMRREVPAGPRDVKCDVCKGRKLKAVKSCLVCLASYCQTHIQPHYESEAFKKHKLVNASLNLQQQICPQHHKALEIYCYNDLKCICVVCMGDQHSGHKTVSAAAEMAKKQRELKIKKMDFSQKITDISKKVQAFRKAVDSHKNYSSQSGLYVYTTSPRDVNDLLTFENVEESVSELKSQLVNLCKEHMARISKKVADVQISKTSWLQDMDSPEASASYHSSDDECFFSPVLSDPEDETE